MQVFQLLTRQNQIVLIRPYNPFAPGIIEQVNALPVEQQAQRLNEALLVSGIVGKLEIVSVNGVQAINVEKDVIIYSLTVM